MVFRHGQPTRIRGTGHQEQLDQVQVNNMGILFNFEGIFMKISGPWVPNGQSPRDTDHVEADGE